MPCSWIKKNIYLGGPLHLFVLQPKDGEGQSCEKRAPPVLGEKLRGVLRAPPELRGAGLMFQV